MSNRKPKPCPNCEASCSDIVWIDDFTVCYECVCGVRGAEAATGETALDLWDAMLRRREVRDDLAAIIVSLLQQDTAHAVGEAENPSNAAADAYRDAAERIGKLALDYCHPAWMDRQPNPGGGHGDD